MTINFLYQPKIREASGSPSLRWLMSDGVSNLSSPIRLLLGRSSIGSVNGVAQANTVDMVASGTVVV